MIVLAIDTSLGTSVAVVSENVVVERSTSDSRRHAEHIGTFISEVLTEGGLDTSDITDVVAGLGPGPFTGLRVGIAAAVAFSMAKSIPLHGIPSHDAVALGRGDCCVVTDVRRRELAATTYRDGHAIVGPSLTTEESLSNDVDLNRYPEIRATEISAVSLARAAMNRLHLGDNLSAVVPLYLRAPDATPNSGPKRVSG